MVFPLNPLTQESYLAIFATISLNFLSVFQYLHILLFEICSLLLYILLRILYIFKHFFYIVLLMRLPISFFALCFANLFHDLEAKTNCEIKSCFGLLSQMWTQKTHFGLLIFYFTILT